MKESSDRVTGVEVMEGLPESLTSEQRKMKSRKEPPEGLWKEGTSEC